MKNGVVLDNFLCGGKTNKIITNSDPESSLVFHIGKGNLFIRNISFTTTIKSLNFSIVEKHEHLLIYGEDMNFSLESKCENNESSGEILFQIDIGQVNPIKFSWQRECGLSTPVSLNVKTNENSEADIIKNGEKSQYNKLVVPEEQSSFIFFCEISSAFLSITLKIKYNETIVRPVLAYSKVNLTKQIPYANTLEFNCLEQGNADIAVEIFPENYAPVEFVLKKHCIKPKVILVYK